MAVLLPGVQRQTRRVKLLLCEPSILFGLLKGLDGSCLLLQSGIPEDAKLLHAAYDANRNLIVMAVESESFPEVFEGEHYPDDLNVNFSKYIGFKWPTA